MLISVNFILIEAFKWVVEVIVKILLGRSFQFQKEFLVKFKNTATQKHGFVLEMVGNLIVRILAWGLRHRACRLGAKTQT